MGSAVAQALRAAGVDTPLRKFGIAQEFLEHAERAEILRKLSLTPSDIALHVSATLDRADTGVRATAGRAA